MNAIENAFDHPDFYMSSLTDTINLAPVHVPQSREKIFKIKRVKTRVVAFEENNGLLKLIKSGDPRNHDNYLNKSKRKVRFFEVPIFPLNDTIEPEEVQDLKGFGVKALQGKAKLVLERITLLKTSHKYTQSFLKMGAIKGVIYDADGSVLYDLFDEFSITKKIVNFELDKEDTDVSEKCRMLTRHMEDHIRGDRFEKVKVEVSEEFFDKLVAHPSVKEIYLGHKGAVAKFGGDNRKNFEINNVIFSENREKHIPEDEDAEPLRFVDANKGHAYPTKTTNTFYHVLAPAKFNEVVNTEGKEFYAKIKVEDFDIGYTLHTQSAALPLSVRPRCLIEVHAMLLEESPTENSGASDNPNPDENE